MKVLLDENPPHLLRNNLGDHDVFTVRYKGWAASRTLPGGALQYVVLSCIDWHILKNHLPLIIAAIDRALPGTLQAVDCGAFTRKK